MVLNFYYDVIFCHLKLMFWVTSIVFWFNCSQTWLCADFSHPQEVLHKTLLYLEWGRGI